MSSFRKKAAQLGALMNHVPQRHEGLAGERLLVNVRMEPASRQRALEILMKSRVCRDQKTVVVSDRGNSTSGDVPISTWFDLAWKDMRHRTKTWNASDIFPSELPVKTILGLTQGERAQYNQAKPSYQAGIVAKALLGNFYSSADKYPDVRHLPRGYRDEPTGSYGAKIGLQAIDLAQAAWAAECSLSNPVVSRMGVVKMWLSMGRASDYSCVVVPHGEELCEAHIAWLDKIDASMIVCDDPVPRAACESASLNLSFRNLVSNATVYDGMIHEEVSPGIATAIGQVQNRLTGKDSNTESVVASRREEGDIGKGVCDINGAFPRSMICMTETGRLRDALRCLSNGQSAILPNTRTSRDNMAALKNFNRLIHHTNEGSNTPAPESSFLRRFPSVAEAKKRTTNDPVAQELLKLAIELNSPDIESDLDLLEYLITDGEQVKSTPAMRPIELHTLQGIEQDQIVLPAAQLGNEFETRQPVASIYQDLALYRALQHVSHEVYASPEIMARLALYGQKGQEIYRSSSADFTVARSPTASEEQLAFFREETARRLAERRNSTASKPSQAEQKAQPSGAGESDPQHDRPTLDEVPKRATPKGHSAEAETAGHSKTDSQRCAFSAADIVDRAAKSLSPDEARSAFQAFRSGAKSNIDDHGPDVVDSARDAGPKF